jgi:hypothetical protein
MSDKYHSDTQEKIESISYLPGLQDSGDLEAATKSITATTEATGIANADYNVALTLPKPDDLRLSVLRIAARLAVTIDSMTAGQLNCRVYVDTQDVEHRLFDINWTSAGAKLAAVDTHAYNLSTVFNLLKDGQAHTFYFFFWVDTGNAVISLCQFWEGVGTCDTGWWGVDILALDYTGMVSTSSRIYIQGTGSLRHMLIDGVFNQGNFITDLESNVTIFSFGETTCLVRNGVYIHVGGSITTDLNYIYGCTFVLQGEQ